MDTDAYDDTDYGKFPLGVDDKGNPVEVDILDADEYLDDDEDEDEDEFDGDDDNDSDDEE